MKSFSRRFVLSPLLLLLFAPITQLFAQPSAVADCALVLKTRDYYSYAASHNLQLDYLQTIDEKTFNEIKHQGAAGFSLGPVKLDGSYNDFDQSRREYFKTTHYQRSESQASNILSITTSPRAYDAYTECLKTTAQPPGLVVWASSEDTNSITLHVKYVNPPGVTHVLMEGHVTGGAVKGAPKFHLFKDGTRFGVNRDLPLIIDRTPGTSKTTVVVIPSDGSTSYTHDFYRADATIGLTVEGTTDILRNPSRTARVASPDNNERRNNCPARFVGMHDGKYCTAETKISLSTQAPFFFKSAALTCAGGGCGWADTFPATLSTDGLAANGTLNKWGSAVTLVLVAQEYEKLSSLQCRSDGPIPVLFGQTISLAADKDCLPITYVHARILSNSGVPEGSEYSAKFGASDGTSKLIQTSNFESGSGQVATYKVDK